MPAEGEMEAKIEKILGKYHERFDIYLGMLGLPSVHMLAEDLEKREPRARMGLIDSILHSIHVQPEEKDGLARDLFFEFQKYIEERSKGDRALMGRLLERYTSDALVQS